MLKRRLYIVVYSTFLLFGHTYSKPRISRGHYLSRLSLDKKTSYKRKDASKKTSIKKGKKHNKWWLAVGSAVLTLSIGIWRREDLCDRFISPEKEVIKTTLEVVVPKYHYRDELLVEQNKILEDEDSFEEDTEEIVVTRTWWGKKREIHKVNSRTVLPYANECIMCSEGDRTLYHFCKCAAYTCGACANEWFDNTDTDKKIMCPGCRVNLEVEKLDKD